MSWQSQIAQAQLLHLKPFDPLRNRRSSSVWAVFILAGMAGFGKDFLAGLDRSRLRPNVCVRRPLKTPLLDRRGAEALRGGVVDKTESDFSCPPPRQPKRLPHLLSRRGVVSHDKV